MRARDSMVWQPIVPDWTRLLDSGGPGLIVEVRLGQFPVGTCEIARFGEQVSIGVLAIARRSRSVRAWTLAIYFERFLHRAV